MGDKLNEKLDEIIHKKREEWFKELKKEIRSEDINDAIEIAKHESTIKLPGASLLSSVSAIFVTLFVAVAAIWPDLGKMLETIGVSTNLRYGGTSFLLVITFSVIIININGLVKESTNWKYLYFELIELKRSVRGNIGISTLDTTISGVKAINSRADVENKTVSSLKGRIQLKLYTLEKRIRKIIMNYAKIFFKACFVRFPEIELLIWSFILTISYSFPERKIINLNFSLWLIILGIILTVLIAIYDCVSYKYIKKLEKDIETI